MTPSNIELAATVIFGLAVLHTFTAARFQRLANRYPAGSVRENLLHLLGEVEIVFGLWAAILALAIVILDSPKAALDYVEGRNFSEPLFVFAIMAIAATRPVLDLAAALINGLARLLPGPPAMRFYIVTLTVGPLLGSVITEPAAMTVTALLLKQRFFDAQVSVRFRYATLGLLFVNVSIGGTLTHFAAPPVLMVAEKWNLGLITMLTTLGWKCAVAITLATVGTAFVFLRELRGLGAAPAATHRPVYWVGVVHLGFLGAVVAFAHHPVLCMGTLLFFLGFTAVTREHQDDIRLRESLLVAFFLAGLVVLGGLQRWWLEPILQNLGAMPLFLGATGLTAITDNAALTYLGSQVPGLSEVSRYALLAGAVAGGGLTVIANAPNPAGYSILKGSFPDESVSPLGLLAGAAIPTAIGMACLWFLPHL